MALKVTTADPRGLVESIRKAIDDGDLDTWETTENGLFTHSTKSGQWKNKAWLKPMYGTDYVKFYIIRPKDKSISREVYAVYHGRFCEMLLAHFDKRISLITASALGEKNDLV